MDNSPGEYQHCPLQFYDFRQLDYKQHCPVYSNILDNPESGISVEDLEAMSSELTALQQSVQSRISLLEAEYAVLNEWQIKREYRKRKHSDTADLPSGPARQTSIPSSTSSSHRLSDSIHSKRMKLDIERKSRPAKRPQDNSAGGEEPTTVEYSTPKVKGDAPDRFWASVEPYCADISETEIRLLQDGLRNKEMDVLLRVPPLGQHYGRRWASEDLREERVEAARLTALAEPGSGGGGGGGGGRAGRGVEPAGQWGGEETDMLLVEAESLQRSVSDQRHGYGPLTERLLAAFLEDTGGRSPLAVRPHPQQLAPPTSLPQAESLEKRIRNELISLGLFEPAEEQPEGEEDEVQSELKGKQNELQAVCEYNQKQRQTLLSLARAELKKQELRKQAQSADEEVMEWLRRLASYKQKRKGVGRKEREAVWKALEHRDTLQQRLGQQ